MIDRIMVGLIAILLASSLISGMADFTTGRVMTSTPISFGASTHIASGNTFPTHQSASLAVLGGQTILITVYYAYLTGGPATIVINDTQQNTYTQQVSEICDNVIDCEQLWAGKATQTGANVVEVTISNISPAPNYWGFIYATYNNVGRFGARTSLAMNNAVHASTISLTTIRSNSLLVCSLGISNSPISNWVSGQTNREIINNALAGAATLPSAYFDELATIGNAGTYTCTSSWGAISSDPYVDLAIELDPATSPDTNILATPGLPALLILIPAIFIIGVVSELLSLSKINKEGL